MKTIGVLVASRMGQLSQAFCVQKMREAKIDHVIVVSKFFSANVRSNYKIPGVEALPKALEGFDDDDLVICSALSKAYRTMMSKGVPNIGTAYEFDQHMYVRTVQITKKIVEDMDEGANFSLTVGDLRRVMSEDFTPALSVSDDTPHDTALKPHVEDSNDNGLPTLTVAFLTHNRTTVAKHCLLALCEKLRYGGVIRFCICDDRSEKGHVEALEKVVNDHGAECSVQRTSTTEWGLGASMNNGLRDAFAVSPVVLTVEDDFLLTKEFDITPYVTTIMDNDVAGIRLAYVRTKPIASGRTFTHVMPSGIDGFKQIIAGTVADAGKQYVFNNQVMLRHRRVYDILGLYMSGRRSDIVERDMCRRYSMKFSGGRSSKCRVLYPSDLKTDTYDNGLFLHIGKSTEGHAYSVPSGYNDLNNGVEPVRKPPYNPNTGPLFRIITPVRNRASDIERCAKMLEAQTFRNFEWCVADDASTDNTAAVLEKLASERPWIKYVVLSEHKCAGGARNAALALSDARYTLYLDADDYIASTNSLQAIFDSLVAEGYPDILALSYYWGATPRVRRERTPASLVSYSNQAPWTVCHSSDISCEFAENRQKCNDVLWYLRLCDKAASVAPCKSAWYKYRVKARDSITAGTPSKIARASDYYLIGDILMEHFSHDYVNKAAANLISVVKRRCS